MTKTPMFSRDQIVAHTLNGGEWRVTGVIEKKGGYYYNLISLLSLIAHEGVAEKNIFGRNHVKYLECSSAPEYFL